MAIFRFDNFCEQWASVYKPISHIAVKASKQKRFFRHDTLDERIDVVKNLTGLTKCNLFMSCITAFDGELTPSSENSSNPNFYTWRRHALFWAKGEQASVNKQGVPTAPLDELSAAEAKARGVEAATDFIAFMRKQKEDRRGEMAGVDLESIEIVTLPVSFNGWWITVINFDQQEPRQKCVVESKYDTELIATLFEGTPIAAAVASGSAATV